MLTLDGEIGLRSLLSFAYLVLPTPRNAVADPFKPLIPSRPDLIVHTRQRRPIRRQFRCRALKEQQISGISPVIGCETTSAIPVRPNAVQRNLKLIEVIAIDETAADPKERRYCVSLQRFCNFELDKPTRRRM